MANGTRRTLLFALALTPFSSLTLRGEARADEGRPLSQAEIARIERGETVVRPQTLDVEGQRYIGGVTYTIVPVTTEELIALMDSESAYGQVLPRAKFVKRISFGPDDGYMEVHHGNALVDAAYTMYLKKEPELSRIRFWLDRSRPHDVDDAWGFFRYRALPPAGAPGASSPRLLLTYGALVNLGNGMLRSLYEERVRIAMLSVPQQLRQYVAHTLRR